MTEPFTLYKIGTGEIVAFISVDREQLAANTPAGHEAIGGRHDPRNRRIVDGVAVAYQPPAPDAYHVWDAAEELWMLPEAAQRRDAERQAARLAIAQLETGQLRALREQAIGRGDALELKVRLEDIDNQIAALRATLSP